MSEPGTFPSGFPVPPLQTPPDVEVRPDGTFSDPAYDADAAVVRLHRIPDAIVADIFHNRFLSDRSGPTLQEQVDPVTPGQTREVELGGGKCQTERLHEVETFERWYNEVRCRWERWVLPADHDPAGMTSLDVGAGADLEAEPTGLGRVAQVNVAAGAGALDTSTDMTFGDETGDFFVASATDLVALMAAGRKVAEGWNPVGFWYETTTSTTVAPRQEWKPEGDPHPCGKAPPPPLPPDDAVAVPGPQLEPAGGGRIPWWLVIPLGLILILGLLWLLLLNGDDDAVAEGPGDDVVATGGTGTEEPTQGATTTAPTERPTATEAPTGTGTEEPTGPPVDAPPREATVTQGGFGDGRASARGWYLRALMVAATIDPTFWELWFGTYPGSVVMFNMYGPPGSIPGIEDWDEDSARTVEELIEANTTDGPEGPDLDWDSFLAGLGADPGEVCGARIVLDIEADQGGDLPGFDASGNLAGSGQYTGQTAGCSGDFAISLEATIAPAG